MLVSAEGLLAGVDAAADLDRFLARRRGYAHAPFRDGPEEPPFLSVTRMCRARGSPRARDGEPSRSSSVTAMVTTSPNGATCSTVIRAPGRTPRLARYCKTGGSCA